MIDKRVNTVIQDSNTVWIMYNKEDSDKYFSKYITNKTIVGAYAIIAKEKCYLLVNSLDYYNVKDIDDVIEYKSADDLIKSIEHVISKLGFPKNIMLNYSESNDILVDVLGHGTYKYITEMLEKIYSKNCINDFCFYSAENLLYSLMDIKSEEEIKYLKIAANRALEILEETFNNIKVGMNEIEIANLVKSIYARKPKYFKLYNIASEEYAWNEDSCPVVLCGPSFLKGGHATASEEILKQGYTIYFDFGVTIILKDGRKFSSDIQRMGYALDVGEEKPPKEVEDIFNTLVKSIKLGMKSCTPDNKGYIIDEIVRGYIISKGYPNYDHATGHPVGEKAHNPGTLLSKKGAKLSDLFLQENGVYTIEPRITLKNGGSIEEMVLVTKNGGVTLCKAQEKLYII